MSLMLSAGIFSKNNLKLIFKFNVLSEVNSGTSIEYSQCLPFIVPRRSWT